ncbi:non-LTR retroelement reverse transcriptase [Tanacetum coccineum]
MEHREETQGKQVAVVFCEILEDVFFGPSLRTMEFARLDWEVKLEHCYREANRVADWLANHGCEQEERLCMFDSPLPNLGS